MNKDLPFDQYTRQLIAADIVNRLRGETKKLKILDIGGYKGQTANFFPKDSVIVVDIFDVDEPNYVKASGTKLPFSDNEYDFCLSFDVLEHVIESDRKKFITEALRVSSRGFILCAPHNSKVNTKVEIGLNNYYKAIHGQPHHWLREHIDNKLPNINDLLDSSSSNLNKHTVYSNDVVLWETMQSMLFLNEKYPQGSQQLIALNRYVNQELAFNMGEDKNTTYRQITAILHHKSDLKLIEKIQTKQPTIEEKAKIKEYEKEFYLSLVEGIDKERKEERAISKALKKERDIYKKEMDDIRNSKTWKALRKISNLRNIRKRDA